MGCRTRKDAGPRGAPYAADPGRARDAPGAAEGRRHDRGRGERGQAHARLHGHLRAPHLHVHQRLGLGRSGTADRGARAHPGGVRGLQRPRARQRARLPEGALRRPLLRGGLQRRGLRRARARLRRVRRARRGALGARARAQARDRERPPRGHRRADPSRFSRRGGFEMRVLLLACSVLVASQASGQPSLSAFPTKPIRVVVPSPPGGPPDLIIRMLTPKMAGLGQPLVVENRAGAGGIVGTAYVAKTPPDGYTWLVTTASHVNTPPFNTNVPFDPVKDFTHVTLIAQNFGQALTVPASSSFKSVQELIAAAKGKPGKLNYGSAGIGTASHIPAEVMKSMSNTDIVAVQYKGVPEVITDVLAGRMDMMFVGTQIAAPLLQSGRVRILALTGAKRWKGLPDVPTMQESGFKGYNLINWFGLWLPAGASRELVARLHSEVVKALAEPEVLRQFDVQGLEAVGSKPDDFARFVAKESAFITELARKLETAGK